MLQTIQKDEEPNERKEIGRTEKNQKTNFNKFIYKLTIQIKKKFFPHQKT
jgi:hypothetical protein